MRPDSAEVEVALLCTEVGLRRPSGFGPEGSMHSFVTASCGLPGSMVSGRIPRRIHQALSRVRRARPMEAKGVLVKPR